MSAVICNPKLIQVPAQRARAMSSLQGLTTGVVRFATDSAGQTTVTLTNVAVGSRYRIERQGDGSLATPTGNAEGVAASSTVSLLLDYYAGGSPNNDLRIKVRKGTSPQKYQPFETQVVLSAAGASAFVAQIPDPIA